MTTIAELATTIQTVLTTTADRVARETGCVQRTSKLSGAALVQTLVLGWLQQPQASLGQLTQLAATVGVAITPQGLDQRFTRQTADCLEALVQAIVRETVVAQPVAIPILQRFTAVTVQDSSTIALPAALVDRWRGTGHGTDPTAATTAALKVQVRWDLCTGRLEGPLLSAGRTSDRRAAFQSQQAAPLPPKALRLADLGYFTLAVFTELAAHDVYFLSRLQVQTAVFVAPTTVVPPAAVAETFRTRVRDRARARGRTATGDWVGPATGTQLHLLPWLQAQPLGPVEHPVHLGVQEQVPARLLAVRVPPAVADERRRRLRAEANAKGLTVSQARLRWASWTILVTNVPPTLLTLEEALVLLRARWQIELLFKLWKQHGVLDEWRSAKPWRVLCEVYAKLVALVIQHWVLLLSCWAFPDRRLVKAAQTVRGFVSGLAAALGGLVPLVRAITHLCATIRRGCRLNPRKTAPNTCQRLLALAPIAVLPHLELELAA